MKKSALVLFCAAAAIMAGTAGCSNSADSHPITAAERDSLKAKQPTPEEMQAEMARMAKAQSQAQQAQQPK